MTISMISKNVFVPSPGPGIGVWGASYYTEKTGGRLMSTHSFISRSDTVDVAYIRFSDDNGLTWGPVIERAARFADPGGTGRRHLRGGYVDPRTGKFLALWVEGVLPTDNPLEGMRHWTLHTSVSADGGRSTMFSGPIIQDGPEFNARHPFPDVTVGKNCVMMGDLGMRPITRSDGAILIPVQSSPVGPDGEYYCPTGAFTYLDAMVLVGRWTPKGRLSWTASQRVKGDPERTTRGLFEPTIAPIRGDRLLMVMRGSNDKRLELPGYKWSSLSDDGGMTWSAPEPWMYTDGTIPFSPSSCSQLVQLTDGRLFWFGNLCKENAKGNMPRRPLLMVEVDLDTGRLCRDRTFVVDDQQPGENPGMFLSNFLVREDRSNGRLLLHLTRLFAQVPVAATGTDWTGDSLLYEFDPPK